MIPIDSRQQAALIAAPSLMQRLAIGENVKVDVLGQTRHGLAVSMGQDVFQLVAPSRLATAKTLTLQVTGPSKDQVEIVARDDRPLSRSIATELTVRPQPSPEAASAVRLSSRVSLTANPLNTEGKVVGPAVSVHLHTSSTDAVTGSTAGKSPLAPEDPSANQRELSSRLPTAVQQQAEPPKPVINRPGTPILQDVEPGDARATPSPISEKSIEEGVLRRATSDVQAPPARTTSSTLSNVSGGVLRTQVDVLRPHQNVINSTSDQGQPKATKNKTLSALSIYRGRSPAVPNLPTPTPAVEMKSAPPAPTPAVEAKSAPPASPPISSDGAVVRDTATKVIVAGRTDGGKVIIEAEGRRFRIEQPVDLPIGTALQATFGGNLPALAMPADPRPVNDQATSLTRLIELLDDIDKAGRYTAEPDRPAAGRQLPLPDKHLASRFLSLLAMDGEAASPEPLPRSAKSNDVSMIQKEQVRTLVRELGNIASEPLAEGWKSLTLPLGMDQGQAVSFFFRGQSLDPDGEGVDHEDKDAEMQRAVFDVSFSRLGRCQIDVLCQERRFDLLIRSDRPLASSDQGDIAVLFASACEIAGMQGDIGFRIGGFFEPARTPIEGKNLKT